MRSVPSDMRRNSSPSGCATSAARSRRARRPITVYITWLEPPVQFRDVSMWRENINQLPTPNYQLPTRPIPSSHERSTLRLPSGHRWASGGGDAWELDVGDWELFCNSHSLANFRNT